MYEAVRPELEAELARIRAAGLWKDERVLVSPQGPVVRLADGREVLVFCSNNYLGLSNHPEVVAAAHRALESRGYGLSSVRFVCGTQDLHRELERRLAEFLGLDDALLYAACFDANGGVFEPLLGEGDAVLSDALNHASIIDGVRLCRARRWRYASGDVADLERCLAEAHAAGCRRLLVATDGIFSMEGAAADLAGVCDAADRHGALVMVDDSHGIGVVGETGRGTLELTGVRGRVDLVTGTLGKALGGAIGGFTAGRQALVDLLRQRSRPYVFSNALPPVVLGASLAVLDLLERPDGPRARLAANTRRFRDGLAAAGFELRPGTHPIVPILLGRDELARDMARRMLEEGILVTGFWYPVVPKGGARIRAQVSAAHEPEHLDRAVDAFTRVGRELGVVRT